jgi:hypothetical protein
MPPATNIRLVAVHEDAEAELGVNRHLCLIVGAYVMRGGRDIAVSPLPFVPVRGNITCFFPSSLLSARGDGPGPLMISYTWSGERVLTRVDLVSIFAFADMKVFVEGVVVDYTKRRIAIEASCLNR